MKILQKVLNISKYNLKNVSFDVLSKIFKDLSLKEIMNVCVSDKQIYHKCRESDLYWRKYAKENFDITNKPSKFKKWFDLVQNFSLRPNIGLSVDFNSIGVFEYVMGIHISGKYLYYSENVKIKLDGEIRIYLDPKKRVWFKTDIKLASAIVLNRLNSSNLVYLIGLTFDNKLKVYAVEMPQNIGRFKDPIVKEFKEISLNLTEITQIKKYRNHKCYISTEDGLYDVFINAKDELIAKPIKIPKVKIKKIAVKYGSVNIAFIDTNGKLWVKGHYNDYIGGNKLGQYKVSYIKFTQIPSEVSLKDLIIHHCNVFVLDINNEIWNIGTNYDEKTRKLTEHPFLTKITILKRYKEIPIPKIKAISIYSNYPLILTHTNQIYALDGIKGEYKYFTAISPEFELVEFTENNYLIGRV